MATRGSASRRHHVARSRGRYGAGTRGAVTRSVAADSGCRGHDRRRPRCCRAARECAGGSCRERLEGVLELIDRGAVLSSYICVDKYISRDIIRQCEYLPAPCVLFASSPSVGAKDFSTGGNDADIHSRSDSGDRPPGVRSSRDREAAGRLLRRGDVLLRPDRTSSTRLGYTDADLAAVPDGADLGLGCGNPQAIARSRPGERVLDLGSGGGFDAFLAARQVGPTGSVIGVDMTPEMIALARRMPRRSA